ncbi:MAG: tetratricopeptide repeat protein [Planctomycetota bacterium]
MKRKIIITLGFITILAAACGSRPAPPEITQNRHAVPPGAEAISIDGRPLYRIKPADDKIALLEANLTKARADYERNPNDLESIIWYGRRLAYLGRFNDAIEVFTKGIEKHRSAPELYRHRGHRFITIRLFRKAEEDLTKAAELVRGQPDKVEADGAPNDLNIPTSTLQHNIYYHLGLSQYLLGDYEKALSSYRECLRIARNSDSMVSALHWIYCIQRRLGRHADAKESLAIVPELIEKYAEIIENHSYYKLLLVYRGELKPDELLGAAGPSGAAAAYGVGNYLRAEGDEHGAREILDELLTTHEWAAFGYIAAEADYVRLGIPIPAVK